MATSYGRSFDKAFQVVLGLISDFRNQQNYYLSPQYNETQVRADFIDKFWIALGWDIKHDKQKNPYEQEVKVERNVNMPEGKKRADYAFYVKPDFHRVRFFVEAKKPSVEIRSKDNYFQAARYGWNAHTPLVVLTDFEQFDIIDCRQKPDINAVLDSAIKRYRFTDFEQPEMFAEVYFLFSRESVAQGSIDKYVNQYLSKTTGRVSPQGQLNVGFQSIDNAFLRDLEAFREKIAKSLKVANSQLNSEELTEATQRILDRLVFLRFLEDKFIEPEPVLQKFATAPSSWRAFQNERQRLDTTYNGNIFKKHLIVDSADTKISEEDFQSLCHWLASDNSPYLFSVVPIHILGSIYERFLGSVIITDGESTRVEQKVEVRKSGGVYYTPDYIVRYIVDKTVGQQIQGKTPAEIQQMRFADIACGSGSFLLEVYDELLRYHTSYYNANPAEARKARCEKDEETGGFRLTLWQKRDILINNIFGVDLDSQAVEVTQLSLYLKLLETETISSAQSQLTLGGAILPTLTANIVCGNALVDWSIIADDEIKRKVNPFDFKDSFPRIFRDGGFDAIVGNPPYIRIQAMQESLPVTVPFFQSRYESAKSGNYDIYVLFIEQALRLLKPTGQIGYITPHRFFNAGYGEGIRNLIASGSHLSHVVSFGDQQVFAGATTYTAILLFNKQPQETVEYHDVNDLTKWRDGERSLSETVGVIPSTSLSADEWHFATGPALELLTRLRNFPTTLATATTRIFQGIKTSADKIYILDLKAKTDAGTYVFSPQTQKEYTLEPALLHPLIKGGDSKSYYLAETRRLILFPYAVGASGKRELISPEVMERDYPCIWEYLRENREYLENRESGKMRHEKWYEYGRTQALDVVSLPKIFTPDIAPRAAFSLDDTGERFFTGGAAGGYGILPEAEYDPKYLLALLNSRLLEWYLRQISVAFRGGWFSYESRFIHQLPIVPPTGGSHEIELVRLVTEMMDAKRERASALTDRNIQYSERRIADLDNRINSIVYQLYDVTKQELALIEENLTFAETVRK